MLGLFGLASSPVMVRTVAVCTAACLYLQGVQCCARCRHYYDYSLYCCVMLSVCLSWRAAHHQGAGQGCPGRARQRVPEQQEVRDVSERRPRQEGGLPARVLQDAAGDVSTVWAGRGSRRQRGDQPRARAAGVPAARQAAGALGRSVRRQVPAGVRPGGLEYVCSGGSRVCGTTGGIWR